MRPSRRSRIRPLLATKEITIAPPTDDLGVAYDPRLMVTVRNGSPVVLDRNTTENRGTRVTEARRETTDDS